MRRREQRNSEKRPHISRALLSRVRGDSATARLRLVCVPARLRPRADAEQEPCVIGGKVLVRSRCSQFVSVELPAPQIRGLATVALAGGAQTHAQQSLSLER